MRVGFLVSVTPDDLARLRALIKDRDAPQKHVWGRRSCCSAPKVSVTSAIMRETGKAKTSVWRWQERFAAEGFKGLLRDNTRPSRIPRLYPFDRRARRCTDDGARRPVRRRIGRARLWPRRQTSASPRCSTSGAPIGFSASAASHPAIQALQESGVRRQIARAPWSGATCSAIGIRQWLARLPRWTFHFTPISASWLNAVEGFIAILTKRRLNMASFDPSPTFRSRSIASSTITTNTRNPRVRARKSTANCWSRE